MNIEAANNKTKVKYANGNTGNIIQEVIDCYKSSHQQVKDFAPQLQGSTIQDTCNNVWNFIKYNITYKIDPPGVQWIRTPARLWKDKEGDCKSFSVMAASLLSSLGITPTIRFVSYNPQDATPTHVYVVVKQNGKEIIVDAVYTAFNKQKKYFFKQDYIMPQIARLSGINNTENGNTIKAVSSPRSRSLAIDLYQLLSDASIEAANNGGTLSPARAALYNKYITRTAKALDVAAKAPLSQNILGNSISGILEDLGINTNNNNNNNTGGNTGTGTGTGTNNNTESFFDKLLKNQSIIGGVLGFLSGLFGGGKSDGEKMRDDFISKGLTVDQIVAWYVINKCNDLAFLHQCQELFGAIAPSQGHGWDDRTSQLHYSVAKAFNDCVIKNYTSVGKSANDPEIAQLGMLWDLNRTLPEAKSNTGSGTGTGGSGKVDDLQNTDDKQKGLGLLAAAGAALAFLK